MPKIESGNPERIYTLGNLGRDFLSREYGVSFSLNVRSASGAHLSFSQVKHNLILTRFLVAARIRAANSHDFRLSEVRICYELSASYPTVGRSEKVEHEKVLVIPDAWLLFERLKSEKVVEQLPVLLEIDRGTMYRHRLKRHVLSRVEFVRSGDYTRVFGVEAVVIAYATTDERGESNEGRRKSLCSWTMEELKETGMESWAEVFRFCSVGLGNVYETTLFDESIWYRPDSQEALRLLGE